MAPRIITIRAKPAPVDIDTDQAAVIVVDMKNDFAMNGGGATVGKMAEENRLEPPTECT